jgi:hypothetical protein
VQRTSALRDDQWERIKDALPGKPGAPGRAAADGRPLMDAAMRVAKAGAPHRACGNRALRPADLPQEHGHPPRVGPRRDRPGARHLPGPLALPILAPSWNAILGGAFPFPAPARTFAAASAQPPF